MVNVHTDLANLRHAWYREQQGSAWPYPGKWSMEFVFSVLFPHHCVGAPAEDVHQLGMYDTEEQAAQAWDRVSWVYRGRAADLNFQDLIHEYDKEFLSAARGAISPVRPFKDAIVNPNLSGGW
eukprot:1160823-Pelagomonas_calceolata.AAC.9